jgi:hypothetical protein
MPAMDQAPRFNQWNANLDAGANATQRSVTGTPWPAFKCPSDPDRGPATNPDGNQGTFDKGNYAYNLGGGNSNENGGNGGGPEDAPTWTAAAYGQNSKNRGMATPRDNRGFPWSARMSDMLDGQSNCVMVGEMRQLAGNNGDCRGAWGKHMCAVVSAYNSGTPNNGPQFIATPNVKPNPAEYADSPVHCANNNGDLDLNCINDGGGDGLRGNAMRSQHAGGVHILLGDGSVRFISNNINGPVYRSLMTIMGNERVGDF